MKTCSIDNCDQKVHAKNLCSKHYWEQKYLLDAEKKKEYEKNHYLKNRDKILEKANKYAAEHKAEQKKISDRFYVIHKDELKKQRKITAKIRRATDPIFKLRRNVSLAVWKLINGKGGSKNGNSILKFLPYSIQEMKVHLEKQFELWMSWDNYGKYSAKTWDDKNPSTWVWNIDHILPQSKLPYKSMNDENFQKCWALSNLRPYSAKQNFIDRNR